MKAVWDACTKANIQVPKEVDNFFNYENPDDKGVVIDLTSDDSLHECNGITQYSADMKDGFEVDLSKLPKNIKILRFVNSY